MDACKPSFFRWIATCDKFCVIRNIVPALLARTVALTRSLHIITDRGGHWSWDTRLPGHSRYLPWYSDQRRNSESVQRTGNRHGGGWVINTSKKKKWFCDICQCFLGSNAIKISKRNEDKKSKKYHRPKWFKENRKPTNLNVRLKKRIVFAVVQCS